ncbi:MAG: enoyl-CoA hydratase [SAR202 cluster bacterium]|nr:enoyl-CoA hydratase [SAR202 cluster bacterium]
MEYQSLLYTVDEHVATITLNRPERMNAFDDLMVSEWADAIRSAQGDEGVRVVVVTGAGRAFCAGANLRPRAEGDVLREAAATAERRNSLRFSVHRVPQMLQYLDKPYIAAVNGAAVGAGMDMCSMADVRIASDHARFAMSYVNIGLIPGDGGAWLLPRLVGVQRALQLIWSGEMFDAQEALRMGYVARVVPGPSLMAETLAYAKGLADGPPVAIQMAKRLVYRGLDSSFLEGLEAAQAAMSIVQSTQDADEGRQAFREKRRPVFKGR